MAFAPPPSRPHFPSGEKVQGMTNMVVKHFRNVCQWISELYPYQTQDARAKERSQGDKSQECRYAWAAVCRASGILGHYTPLCWSGTFLCCQPQSPHWNLHKKLSTRLCMFILDLGLIEIKIILVARSEMLSKRSIQSSLVEWVMPCHMALCMLSHARKTGWKCRTIFNPIALHFRRCESQQRELVVSPSSYTKAIFNQSVRVLF